MLSIAATAAYSPWLKCKHSKECPTRWAVHPTTGVCGICSIKTPLTDMQHTHTCRSVVAKALHTLLHLTVLTFSITAHFVAPQPRLPATPAAAPAGRMLQPCLALVCLTRLA